MSARNSMSSIPLLFAGDDISNHGDQKSSEMNTKFWCTYEYNMNLTGTVKPLLVATSIKQATCIKQACIHSPKKANALNCTCIKQAPVLSKHILIIP